MRNVGEQAERREFRVARGVSVADLSGIHEGYQESQSPRGHRVFTLNVSAERIADVFRRLVQEVRGEGFMVIELPTNRDEERKLRKDPHDPIHRDVFYLDGISGKQMRHIFDGDEDLLVNDGRVSFGFGGQGMDEVFVGPYKIFRIYTEEPEKYRRAMEELGLVREENLKTVRQTFTREHPGQRAALPHSERNIWNLLEEMKGRGMYFAERRDD